MPQGLDGTEKLQARNNIGAAALASLAAPFESRAPSYAWSAGAVCTYGGKLWKFDSNHSGAWTGADAHEVSIDIIMPVTNSLNLNDYSYESLIDNIQFLNGFNRRNTNDEYCRYYKDLNLLAFNLLISKSSAVTAPSWTSLFRLTDNRFYFSDFSTNENMPVGVFGLDGGATLSIGVKYTPTYPTTNTNLVLCNLDSSNGDIKYKDIIIQETNYGAVVSRSFIVTPK
jgi:hypothetical protein